MRYKQGIYRVKNTQKYKGDHTKVVFRSSWERIVFSWLDNSSMWVEWSSEETIIPYVSPLDDRPHRYFIDVKATLKRPDGTLKTYLIEIKPFAQTLPPKTRNKKRLVEELATYSVNQAKWEAAKKYCDVYGYEFKIITEYDIGLKKRT